MRSSIATVIVSVLEFITALFWVILPVLSFWPGIVAIFQVTCKKCYCGCVSSGITLSSIQEILSVAGADPGFFLGGGAPLRNDVNDRWGKQILKASTNKTSSEGEWGAHPLHPPPRSTLERRPVITIREHSAWEWSDEGGRKTTSPARRSLGFWKNSLAPMQGRLHLRGGPFDLLGRL